MCKAIFIESNLIVSLLHAITNTNKAPCAKYRLPTQMKQVGMLQTEIKAKHLGPIRHVSDRGSMLTLQRKNMDYFTIRTQNLTSNT